MLVNVSKSIYLLVACSLYLHNIFYIFLIFKFKTNRTFIHQWNGYWGIIKWRIIKKRGKKIFLDYYFSPIFLFYFKVKLLYNSKCTSKTFGGKLEFLCNNHKINDKFFRKTSLTNEHLFCLPVCLLCRKEHLTI